MNEDISPCFWMKHALNRLLEGRRMCLVSWYARKHLTRCPNCSKAYRVLLSIRENLLALNQESASNWILSEERWAKIEQACKDEQSL